VTDGQPFGAHFAHAAIGGLVHEEGLATLHALMKDYEAFWPWLARYHLEYVRAVLYEREVQNRRPPSYSRQERDAIAMGKAAIGKTTLAALALLDGATAPPGELIRSYDAFNVSYQLYDDLLDWRDNYTGGLYSYLVVQALECWRSQHSGDVSALPEPDELGRLIYYGCLVEDILREAHEYAEQAIMHVQRLNCPAWVGAIRQLQGTYTRLADDLAQLKQRGQAQRAPR
jgi:hypothetical protein